MRRGPRARLVAAAFKSEAVKEGGSKSQAWSGPSWQLWLFELLLLSRRRLVLHMTPINRLVCRLGEVDSMLASNAWEVRSRGPMAPWLCGDGTVLNI